MTYAKFTKKAGERVSSSTEDPSMFLVGDTVPDWVELPAELGGGRRDVLGSRQVRCPCGRGEHSVRELDLGEQLHVAECPVRGFLWYRREVD